ncbi:trehalase [Spirosoma taeanense]|uniref:Trehalase n=1 Tax=Spirosoma taeanense TaxID=2735870 RepID=A0A6M5YBA2_9BACT|nr:trehalase family glycosidase [Spirosoma taeanense]QJW90570.1 trehalase [Spirosoma taeanense]
MNQRFQTILFCILWGTVMGQAQSSVWQSPDEQFGKLFQDVQTSGVFPDSKTFADATPRFSPNTVLANYEKARQNRKFSLKNFVEQQFVLTTDPPVLPTGKPNTGQSAQEYMTSLWPLLTRQANAASRPKSGSFIPLPKPYVVSNSRAAELTYWDSYFTMLGLQASGQTMLIRNLIDNFAYLIRTFGFVPASNRTYALSRSQPPVFALMVSLLSEVQGRRIVLKYLPELQLEYNFWMDGRTRLTARNPAYRRVARLAEGVYLNRYYDDWDTPRPEAYREDVELTRKLKDKEVPLFYRNLRAGAESGWAFSSRWLKDGKNLRSIRTTDLIPVDLNCLLLILERTLAEGYRLKGDTRRMRMYQILARQRHDAIQRYCWSDRRRFYFDYDFVAKKPATIYSAAAVLPLFVKITTPEQAQHVGQTLEREFLKAGGLMATTTTRSELTWDAPNVHASIQWFAIQGLRNYNLMELANRIKLNWTTENLRFYRATGTLPNTYDATSSGRSTSDEPLPQGYGPTNGVLLRLLKEN